MCLANLSRAAWCTGLLLVAGTWHAGRHTATAADQPSSGSGIVFQTYVRPGEPAYFAIKLSPQVRQPRTQPFDIVVLFDTSASQVGEYRSKAKGSLEALLRAVSNDDRVALLAVDVTTARLTETFVPGNSAAMKEALKALDRRVPLGSTDMQEALDAALAMWPANDATRARSVVYLGDGLSTSCPVPVEALDKIVARCCQRRVAISSYAIGPLVEGGLLGALANHTGGMLLADDVRLSDRQVGNDLASFARGAVVWPVDAKLPAAIKDSYPRRLPPLRFDRDSVLLGTLDPKAIESRQPLSIDLQAELAGQPMTLAWKTVPEQSQPENGYLAKVVELAAMSDGVALPTVGSAGLEQFRYWVNFGAQQLAKLGEQAKAMGRIEDAAKLAQEAERLDPVNAPANLVQDTARAERSPPSELRMVRPNDAPPPGSKNVEVADGALVDNIERHQRIVEGFLQSEVNTALLQANTTMNTDPQSTSDQLKLLLEKVRQSTDLTPEVRSQMVERIEASLRAASRLAHVKIERDLQEQQALAARDARERINRELFVQEQRVDQLMSRFEALMDEERYRDAEALADVAQEIAPGTPGLRSGELTARTTGYTASILAAREMRYKGTVDSLFQVELSNVPSPDDPPIVYPGPEIWQLITERRKKLKSVDLKENSASEAKILEALDEKTDLDFAEQPLSDVVDYLKQRHSIEIQLDKKALADSGIGSEVPITRTLKGITLRSALKLLLGELDLTYVVRNEVLMITSKNEAEQMLSNRVYPVADLIVKIAPPRNMGGPAGGGMGGGLLGTPGGGYGMGGGMGMGMPFGGMGGGMGGMGGGMGGMGMGGMGMGGMGLGGGMGFF